MGRQTLIGDMTLGHWAEYICDIGQRLFPDWEWSTFTTDAYQNFLCDWDGCAVKARKVIRDEGSGRVVEKTGLIFEFNIWNDLFDLSRLPDDVREKALCDILSNGVSEYALRIAPGARYPLYPADYGLWRYFPEEED